MKYLNLLSALLLFAGCTNRKDDKCETLFHSQISLTEEYVGKGGDIVASGGGFVGIEESSSMEEPLYIIRANSNGFKLTRFGTKGQGPDDFLRPYPLQYISDNVFGVYDMLLKNYREVVLSGQGDSVRITGNVHFHNSPFRAVKTVYGQYLGLSATDGMFNVMDTTGTEITSLYEYPYRDEDEHALNNQVRAMAYQGILSISPGGDKFVYAAFDGEIIHFYRILKDSVSVIKKIEKSYPLYKPHEKSATFSWKSIVGYTSVSTTDKFVYALYCGKKLDDMRSGGNDITYDPRELRIFDWDGNLLKKYILDVPCRYICASMDDKKLWAITCAPEIQPVCFNLQADSRKTDADNSVRQASSQSQDRDNYQNKNTVSVSPVNRANNPANNVITNVLQLGKVGRGEVKSLTMPMQIKVTSYYTNGSGISVRDTISPNNPSIILIKIKKQMPGAFSDTVHISSSSIELNLVLNGEVI